MCLCSGTCFERSLHWMTASYLHPKTLLQWDLTARARVCESHIVSMVVVPLTGRMCCLNIIKMTIRNVWCFLTVALMGCFPGSVTCKRMFPSQVCFSVASQAENLVCVTRDKTLTPFELLQEKVTWDGKKLPQ